ncbi:MAG: hypothetical protein VX899_00520 [Myxococcota bacterium]|nr:hypothetical protein [Myxococcota bacterium]
MKRLTTTPLLAATLLGALSTLVACGPSAEMAHQAGDSVASVKSSVPAEGSDEATIALYLANHLDQETLDDDVTLDSRAAANIVTYRAGADGLEGTSDDLVFTTVAELDGVSYVGPSAFEDLVGYGEDTLGMTGESVLGVLVGSFEAEAVLYLANNLSQDALDHDVALDARAARNIVSEGSISDLNQLDAVSYVGQSAMDKLLAYADGMLSGQGLVLRDGTPYATLQDAVDAGGGTISLYKGVYTGETTISTSLDLEGYPAGGSVLDGEGSVRALNITGGSPAFYDLEIRNGTPTGSSFTADGGAARVYSTGTVRFEGVDFVDNSAIMGGAIFASSGTLELYDCFFDGNSASSLGGAIYSYEDVTLDGVDFVDNSSPYGSAVRIFGSFSAPPHLSVVDSSFTDNLGSHYGAIALYDATASITDTDFAGNSPADVHVYAVGGYSGGDLSCDATGCI